MRAKAKKARIDTKIIIVVDINPPDEELNV